MMDKASIHVESKDGKTLPEGAEVLNKRCDVTVREIENGYIVRKSYDIEYTLNGEKNYLYTTKEHYSLENPVKISVPKTNKVKTNLLDEIEKM